MKFILFTRLLLKLKGYRVELSLLGVETLLGLATGHKLAGEGLGVCGVAGLGVLPDVHLELVFGGRDLADAAVKLALLLAEFKTPLLAKILGGLLLSE